MNKVIYFNLCFVALLVGCKTESFDPVSSLSQEPAAAPATPQAPTVPPSQPIAIQDSFCFSEGIPADIPKDFVTALMNKRQNRTVADIPSAGNTYYVCDTGGNDLNDGLSPQTPFKTFDKAVSTFNSKLQAGEQILFCRGGLFTTTTATPRWINPRCKANLPCVVSDYFTADTEKLSRPVIQAGVAGGNIFRLEDSGTADHEEGYLFKDLILKGNSKSGSAVFLYNDITDLTIDNVVIDGFGIGVQVAGSNAAANGTVPGNDRITLRYSDIINNSDQGWLGGNSSDLIEGNCFKNNGYARSIFLHNLYYNAHGGSGTIIRDNILLQNATVNGTKCEAVSLVVHGDVVNLTIENNLVYEAPGTAAATCWGIAVDGGYTAAERFPGLHIKNNLVMNVGNVAIGCTSCSGGQIDGNTVIYSNANMGLTAIAVPNRLPGTGDALTTGMKITNNTIISHNINTTTGVMAKNAGAELFEVMNNTAIFEINLKPNCMSIVNDATSVINNVNNQCVLKN